MKLTSMTNFVLEQTELLYENNTSKLIHRIVNYAQFLKQPLALWMFVPCDEEGNVLEEPIISEYLLDSPGGIPIKSKNTPEAYYYRKAKERVLFEGFEIVEKREVYNSINGILIDLDTQTWQIEGSLGIGGGYLIDETIEDLVTLDLTLTETAIKQIGL